MPRYLYSVPDDIEICTHQITNAKPRTFGKINAVLSLLAFISLSLIGGVKLALKMVVVCRVTQSFVSNCQRPCSKKYIKKCDLEDAHKYNFLRED